MSGRGKTHDLKCWWSAYEEVVAGRKTVEVRRNDRDFAVGDTLRLRAWDPHRGGSLVPVACGSGVSGPWRECFVTVTHIVALSEWVHGCPSGWVAMSIRVEAPS